MTQFFLATNLAALTGRSHTSNVLTSVWEKKQKQKNLLGVSYQNKYSLIMSHGMYDYLFLYIVYDHTCVSWFHTQTLPLYRLANIHGSVG